MYILTTKNINEILIEDAERLEHARIENDSNYDRATSTSGERD